VQTQWTRTRTTPRKRCWLKQLTSARLADKNRSCFVARTNRKQKTFGGRFWSRDRRTGPPELQISEAPPKFASEALPAPTPDTQFRNLGFRGARHGTPCSKPDAQFRNLGFRGGCGTVLPAPKPASQKLLLPIWSGPRNSEQS
jgi:hypothetical protein